MANLDIIRGRQLVATLTNKSGGSVAAGDVVVVDTTTDESFTTTTTALLERSIGIAQETIANNASGRVLLSGYAPLVNVAASVTRGHYLSTSTVAKQATGAASRAAGAFGQFLKTSATPSAWIWGVADQTAAGGGGAGLTTPTLVGQTLTYTTGNPMVVSIPAAAVAGDLLVLFAEQAFALTTPANWEQLGNSGGGANCNGLLAVKHATSGDISGGTVSVSAGGSFAGELILAAVSGVRKVSAYGFNQTASAASLLSGTANAAQAPKGELGLYFGGARASSILLAIDLGTTVASRSADTDAASILKSETIDALNLSHQVTLTPPSGTPGMVVGVVTLSG